ncbi:hypothetical protein Tco_1167866 [Tanacetum coccineum]
MSVLIKLGEDLEASMVDSFALEKLLDLDPYEGLLEIRLFMDRDLSSLTRLRFMAIGGDQNNPPTPLEKGGVVGESGVCCGKVSTLMDTSEELMPNNGQAVSQLEHSRVISCLMYAMTCTRPDIVFVVGKLILEGYTDASWISNTKDNSSTSGCGKEAEWLVEMVDNSSASGNIEDNSSTSGCVMTSYI